MGAEGNRRHRHKDTIAQSIALLLLHSLFIYKMGLYTREHTPSCLGSHPLVLYTNRHFTTFVPFRSSLLSVIVLLRTITDHSPYSSRLRSFFRTITDPSVFYGQQNNKEKKNWEEEMKAEAMKEKGARSFPGDTNNAEPQRWWLSRSYPPLLSQLLCLNMNILWRNNIYIYIYIYVILTNEWTSMNGCPLLYL
jgi:hypothetical protein